MVTITTSSNIKPFNIVNKASILHLACKATAQPVRAPAPNITTLTSVILLQVLTQMNAGLTQSPTAPFVPTLSMHTSTTPHTPTWQARDAPTELAPYTSTWQAKVEDIASLLPIHSPTHLTHYLQFAKANLDVKHAISYHTRLKQKEISPNILHDFNNQSYKNLGILPSNIVHLKRDSKLWWKGTQVDVKQKQSDISESTSACVESNQLPPK